MKPVYLGLLGILALASGVALYQFAGPMMGSGGGHMMQGPHPVQSTGVVPGAPLAEVEVPALSAAARAGQEAFEANCARCHGVNAAGQDGVAPPLVHVIYEPGHHGDQSFHQAVRYGVRAHHWRFGDMPAIDGVSQSQVADIIAYVRELQRANGVF